MRTVQRHSWWVWALLIVGGWVAMSFVAPRDLSRAPLNSTLSSAPEPIASGPR